MRIETLIGLVYGSIGMVAYVLSMGATVALRKQIFSPAFMALYSIAAVVNLATHVNTWILYRLRFEPDFAFYFEFMSNPTLAFFKSIQLFCTNYFYFAQNACVFLLTLNRYTVIFHENCHEWFWKTYKWIIIVIIHTISFGICLGARVGWHANADFVFDSTLPGYAIRNRPDSDLKPVMLAMGCYGAVMLVACSFMSIRLLCRLFELKDNKVDRSFTIITLLTFVAQAANILVVIITSVFYYQEIAEGVKPLTAILPFTSDLFSLGPAVYTLLVPGPIKSFYRELYRLAMRKLLILILPDKVVKILSKETTPLSSTKTGATTTNKVLNVYVKPTCKISFYAAAEPDLGDAHVADYTATAAQMFWRITKADNKVAGSFVCNCHP